MDRRQTEPLSEESGIQILLRIIDGNVSELHGNDLHEVGHDLRVAHPKAWSIVDNKTQSVRPMDFIICRD